jgi:uncharacterized protein (TIGR03084 family)
VTTLEDIRRDLAEEQDALDAVVAPLDASAWATPTPSPGWTVADQIGHLTYFDGTAVTAIVDPDEFARSTEELLRSLGSADAEKRTLFRDIAPTELHEQWRANRRRLAEVGATLEDGQRIPWYGPSMSAKSFLTARLMECWAHGQDVVDAVDGDRPATDRLRHIAQLGVITRGWTYANRKETMPETEVRVELGSPSGDVWTWGPDDATDAVRGPALDFCLVVTQRRHVDDTSLLVTGAAARDWMEKAQVFAGGATSGPPKGGR